MKKLVKLPDDLEELIDRVYRRGDVDFVRRRLVRENDWARDVGSVADIFCFEEQTDFNYGRAYVYDIWLTTDQRATEHKADVRRRLLSEVGEVESVRFAVSVLAPYFLLSYSRLFYQQGKVHQTYALAPMSSSQQALGTKLSDYALLRGYRQLQPSLAEIIIPDVETELRGKGTATLADCLFGAS